MISVRSFISVIVFLLAVQPIVGQPQDGGYFRWDNGISHSAWDVALEPEQRRIALDLWAIIGEDLKTEPNPLAGTYVKGGYNSGYFLRWSVRKGFVVIPYFDQNLITDFAYGRAKVLDDEDVLFTAEKQLNGGRGLPKMPQRWTAILGYLTPVDMLKEFATYRAGLGVFNEFNGDCCEFIPEFLAQRIDRPGMPFPQGIPDKYVNLIKPPITGKIVAIGKQKRVRDWGFDGHLYSRWIQQAHLIPASISAGTLQGVKRNMLFRIIGEPRVTGRYFQVMKAGPNVSSGYVIHEYLDLSKAGTYRDDEGHTEKALPAIRLGIKVTTSPVID